VTGHADDGGPLTRYLVLVAAILGTFLAVFVVAEAFSLPLLDNPAGWLPGNGPPAAAAGVGLLIADVVLPIPASLVMITNGALFGVAAGTALSLLGGVGSAVAGYGLGRYGGRALLRRVCSDAERARADRLVRRWGLLAIAATRPVPLLAETAVVVAGTSGLGLFRTTVAAAVGVLPAAAVYAVAGALSVDIASGFLVFALALAIAAGLWLLGRHRGDG
jgi:uncharacterized membrane protein YdjX (TVP38/TMEM64 family)